MRNALITATLMTLGGALTTLASCTTTTPAPAAISVSAPGAGASVVGGDLAAFLIEHGRRVTIERIVDGDTIAVTGDERVRLLTINAPELHANTKADDADCGATEARDTLAGQIPVGSPIILNGLKGEPATDRYGRTLTNVYTFLSTPGLLGNVSLWMVEQGRARVYTAYPTADTADALQLEDQARAARRGMWGTCPGGAT